MPIGMESLPFRLIDLVLKTQRGRVTGVLRLLSFLGRITVSGNQSWAVVLAGGSGTRFWPRSRQSRPKQLCRIGSADKTLIEQTLERLDGMVPPERRLIVTHAKQLEGTKKLVGNEARWFIAEPEAKNTAAALTMAALEVVRLSGSRDTVMMSFHADHVIQDRPLFHKTLEEAQKTAYFDKLVLLGMKPEYPETGYGYIEKGSPCPGTDSWLVSKFREKPDLNLAQEYIKSGLYYWNSGIFIWKVGVFLGEVSEYLPRTLQRLEAHLTASEGGFSDMLADDLRAVYGGLQNIAVDHAILELSQKTAVTTGEFGWKDVGSWGGLAQCFDTDNNGNLLKGEVLALDSKGCVMDSDGPLIATLGLRDMVVVASGGAVLVCPKERSQQVRQVVKQLEQDHKTEYL